jgi:hypothetical protein
LNPRKLNVRMTQLHCSVIMVYATIDIHVFSMLEIIPTASVSLFNVINISEINLILLYKCTYCVGTVSFLLSLHLDFNLILFSILLHLILQSLMQLYSSVYTQYMFRPHWAIIRYYCIIAKAVLL